MDRNSAQPATLKVAFYIANQGRFFDAAISSWDGGRFSHCELVFQGPANDAWCFSSSNRDGGTRWRWIDLEDGKWELVDVPATEEQQTLARAFCNAEAGKKYDYLGVFGFVLFHFQDRKRWFCSEVVTAALQAGGASPTLQGVKAHRTSPNKLYELLTGKWPWPPRVEREWEEI